MLISPVLEIRPLQVNVDLSRYALIVFASRNAVAASTRFGLAGRKAIAVGRATGQAAKEAGMRVMSASGDADSLVKGVTSMPPDGTVIFLRGRHSRGNVAQRIREAGISIEEAVVYDQRALPLSEKAIRALGGERRLAIPLFSPRSAVLLSEQMRSNADRLKSGAPFCLIAMSEQVVCSWQGPKPAAIRVASRPDANVMAQETAACVAAWS